MRHAFESLDGQGQRSCHAVQGQVTLYLGRRAIHKTHQATFVARMWMLLDVKDRLTQGHLVHQLMPEVHAGNIDHDIQAALLGFAVQQDLALSLIELSPPSR